MTRKFRFLFVLGAVMLAARAAWAQLPSFADLAEKLLPSVVNISTTTLPEDDAAFTPETETLGSGFIISKDGYIVTNQHVINKAKSINITLSDNRKFEAEVIGEDKQTDLALLKISSDKPLAEVVFGDSDALRIGDWVLAIGNPFGLGGSVTAGIVSAKSRDIESGSYDNFIQTDAAINQGNSGGPMFNLKGEVIGVNSAIFSSTGESMGIGFATPAKMAQWVISQLRRDGKVTRGWIGVSIQPNPLQEDGILVSRITEGSPAQKAGILAGDIISKFNKMPVTGVTNLSRIIAESAAGETLNFEILRNGEVLNIKVKAQKMPDNTLQKEEKKSAENTEKKTDKSAFWAGVKIENISDELQQRYHLPDGAHGVVVTDVEPQSDAANKGLQTGNLITKVDKKEVFDLSSFNDYVKQAQDEHNRPVLLTVQDTEAEHFVAIKQDSHEPY